MKTKYKCILLLLLCLPSVAAKNLPQIIKSLPLPDTGVHMEIYDITYKDYLNGIYLLISFYYDDEKIKEVIYKDTDTGALTTKYIYAYDTNNVQNEAISCIWENGDWVMDSKNEYSFDDNGTISAQASYNYKDGEWVGVQKIKKIVNDVNLVSELKRYTWINDDWAIETLQTITFNDDKQPEKNISQVRKNNSLVNSSEITYLYTGGLLMQEIFKSWNGSSFENTFRISYTYTSSNNVETKLFELYSNGVWEKYEKYVYAYSGEEPANIERTLWNSEGEVKTVIALQPDEHVILLNETGDSSANKWKYDYSNGLTTYKDAGGLWEGVSKYVYTNNHDDLFNNTLTSYGWSGDAWAANPANRIKWDYNAASPDVLTFVEERYNAAANTYSAIKEMIFNISDYSVVTEVSNKTIFSVYPNPVSDLLNVNINNLLESEASYFIYTITGRLATKGKLLTQEQTIDIGFLPAGQYVFTVLNGTEYSSLILLKK